MDSLLIIGAADKKLTAFLTRMGYGIIEESDSAKFKDIIQKEVVDVILIDGNAETEPLAICEFLRKHEFSRDLPIILLAHHRAAALELKQSGIDKVECIDKPYSVGTVVSRIATQVRLRKMSGGNDRTATLSEMNAALRDLNQRFAKELEEARSIQSALLPTDLPKSDAYDVAVAYKPLEEVGGDWYFVRNEASGKISLFMADVTGHGLSAAFIGSITKLALFASEKEIPGERLAAMNNLMAPHLPQGRFVTASSFLFDPVSGVLEFGRAGAPPGILFRRATGELAELKGDGFPLGFFEDSEYTKESTSMAPGDVLVILTDGVTEAQNRAKDFFGVDKVGAVLKECPPEASAVDILATIEKRFTSFLDGRILKDDVTILILKRT